MNKILSIDYGSAKVGIALSDGLQTIAWPFRVWKYRDIKEVISKLKNLIDQENVGQIVIGLPGKSSGNEKLSEDEVKKFGEILAAKTLIPIVYENEVFSTSLARQNISPEAKKKNKSVLVDAEAAAVILQSYLDRRQR